MRMVFEWDETRDGVALRHSAEREGRPYLDRHTDRMPREKAAETLASLLEEAAMRVRKHGQLT